MRPLSAPVRWAAVTALTIAASTGCMSVNDDAAGPSPSRSADPKGSAAEPDGDTVPGSGRAGFLGGDAHTHSDREASGDAPRPDASGVAASSAPRDPRPEPGAPHPTGPGRAPTPTPSTPGPGEPPPVTPEPPSQPSPDPDPDPEPEPVPSPTPEPPPSASPAAQLRTQALGGRRDAVPLRTPQASPQVGPV
ncbi:hypothetical protein ACIP6P_09660 [Streptomyces sp. NPDC088729]|uniref:hypothetical protein n=1 Tax=Streptomyces sp. NPDC088729 TaxID=3365876 RepID=UPI00381D077E